MHIDRLIYDFFFYHHRFLEMTKHDLRPADVTHVVCTHGHSDHTGCNYLFQDAKVHIVGHSVSNRETYYLHDFDTADYVIEEGIQVTATPGHTLDSVSVLVSPANIAQRVAVCGDLFEHSHDVEDSSQWIDAGSESPEQQRKSRQRIATDADIIIPGHGELFRVTDEIRAKLTRDMNE